MTWSDEHVSNVVSIASVTQLIDTPDSTWIKDQGSSVEYGLDPYSTYYLFVNDLSSWHTQAHACVKQNCFHFSAESLGHTQRCKDIRARLTHEASTWYTRPR